MPAPSPRSLLDIACGPGYHAWEASRRGLRSIGLDLRPEMLELGAAWSAAEGASVEWLAADMRDFRLERPVDLAICMFDGLDALLSNDDIVRHLRAWPAASARAGCTCWSTPIPRDCSMQSYGDFRYEGRRDGVAVEVTWAIEPPVVDLVAGTAEVVIELRVDDRGRPLRIVDTRQGALPPAAGDRAAGRALRQRSRSSAGTATSIWASRSTCRRRHGG